MTGTADTEAAEFHSTYKLDVRHHPDEQADHPRRLRGPRLQDRAREVHRGRSTRSSTSTRRASPVLVGTTSVEKSAAIARILTKKGIPHTVLNAKHHENEAYVVAQAGRKGAITVSTNMAGRGTDIILGGNPEMLAKLEFKEQRPRSRTPSPRSSTSSSSEYEEELRRRRATRSRELGGLHILGTERHESRRIDNQLRGRAGRQGDPGSSRFYLSLEDDLMRIFAGDRVKNLMERMGMPDDEPIEHPWVTKSVENAQSKVEERNFDIRKNLLEYDDVMNAQRKTVYALRQQLLARPLHARGARRGRASPRARRARSRSTRRDRTSRSSPCVGAPARHVRRAARAARATTTGDPRPLNARGARARSASSSSSRRSSARSTSAGA